MVDYFIKLLLLSFTINAFPMIQCIIQLIPGLQTQKHDTKHLENQFTTTAILILAIYFVFILLISGPSIVL